MKHLILTSLALLVAAAASLAQCPLKFKGAEQATVGIYIASVEEGLPYVADYQSERLLTPASVMKAVTTAAALSRYPGDWQWSTRAMAVGTLGADGVLEGDIVLQGSGDPTLGSVQFVKEQPDFLAELRGAASRLGVKQVLGRARETGPWPDQGVIPSWEVEDVPGLDGAGFYALNYSDNLFTLSVPSLRCVPPQPGLEILQVGGPGGIGISRGAGSNVLRLHGSVPRGKSASLRCSMPNPPLVLLSEVDKALATLRRDVRPSAADTLLLLDYRSPRLRAVCRSLMIRSDNQMAEATLRLLAPGRSRAAALKAERAALADLGVDLSGARLADGSGLSRHNAISASQLGRVLRAMAGNRDYVDAFARVGLDGTVRNFMKGLPRRNELVLKSGSMTGVVCYAGYRLDPRTKAPTHVIAIMVNNAPSASDARAAIARYLSQQDF